MLALEQVELSQIGLGEDWVRGAPILVVDPLDLVEARFAGTRKLFAPRPAQKRLKAANFRRAQAALHDSDWSLRHSHHSLGSATKLYRRDGTRWVPNALSSARSIRSNARKHAPSRATADTDYLNRRRRMEAGSFLIGVDVLRRFASHRQINRIMTLR